MTETSHEQVSIPYVPPLTDELLELLHTRRQAINFHLAYRLGLAHGMAQAAAHLATRAAKIARLHLATYEQILSDLRETKKHVPPGE